MFHREVLTWQGQIDGVALAIPSAHICQFAGAWIDALLMGAEKQDSGIFMEQVICAISMVHIIIKYHYLQFT